MGDARFEPHYARVKRARHPVQEIRAMSDEEVIAALGGASRASDPYTANVLATEALNRVRRHAAITDHLGEGVVALDRAFRLSLAPRRQEGRQERSSRRPRSRGRTPC